MQKNELKKFLGEDFADNFLKKSGSFSDLEDKVDSFELFLSKGEKMNFRDDESRIEIDENLEVERLIEEL